MALGAFLSSTGIVSAWLVFGITWVANVTSAAGVYVAARTLGRRFFTGRLGSRLLNPKHLLRLERLYASYGTRGVFVSRFVPGARAVIPIFAGIAGLTWGRSLIPLALGSAIWYGALTYVAANLLPRLDDVAAFVFHLNWVGLLLGVSVIALASWLIARNRKKAAALVAKRLKDLADRSGSGSAAVGRPDGDEAGPTAGGTR